MRIVGAFVVVAAASAGFGSSWAHGWTRSAPSPAAGGAAAPADSKAVLSAARSQQARFEAIRARHLPRGWAASGERCDEIVGRFCLFYTDEDGWEPPPEPEEVRRARGRLIAELDRAAAQLPGDGWVAGQRVRYLVEADRLVEARSAADDCRATRPWCAALAGYALHAAGDYAAAESAFSEALRAMPHDERCRWRDVSLVLEGRERRRYRDLGCEERVAFEERLWWLSDPLYAEPGNDRRTEHFARRVLDRLQERARSPFGVPWGADLRELLLRYGWPAGWEQVPPRSAALGLRPEIVARFPPRARRFLPPPGALEEPWTIEPASWTLRPERPRSEYAPAYVASFEELEHQLAVFRRGDSALVVAAYDLGADRDSADVHAALVLVAGERAEPVVSRGHGRGRVGVLEVRAAPGPYLLSLEARVPSDSLAARARYAVDLSGAVGPPPALSDLLLVQARDSLPGTLDEIRSLARGSARLRPEERLGLYWEVYGLGPDPVPLSISLTVIDRDRSWLRRTAERLGLARERSERLTLVWEEWSRPEGEAADRALGVDLPALPRGRYTVQLAVTPPDGAAILNARDIRIER